MRQVFLRHVHQILIDVHGQHGFGERGEAGSEKSAAGADLEDPLVGLRIERLQNPAFDQRYHHLFAVGQWNRRVGVGQVGVFRRNEFVPVERIEEVQRLIVEHLPGANLLAHHLPSGKSHIHRVDFHYISVFKKFFRTVRA